MSPNSSIPATEKVKMMSRKRSATFAMLFRAKYRVFSSY